MSVVDGEESRVDFAGILALSSRKPGYAVAAKCLQVQADAERLEPTLRTSDGVTLAPAAWSWYAGAIGEIAVGQMLAELGPEWFVRHAVPIGAGTKDVDHLVIGPAGVFAINTKHHADASVWVGDHVLRVNNSNTSHLRGATRDMRDVSERLSAKTGFAVRVTPVVALFRPGSITDRRPSDARPVSVIDAEKLVRWLRGRPARLSATEVSLVTIAAAEPETWHVDSRAADTLRVMQRFERLVDLVGAPDKSVAPPRARSEDSSPAHSRVRRQPARSRTPASRRAAAPSTRSENRTASVVDLVKFWFILGVMLAVVAAVSAFIGRPCDNPTACAIEPLYRMLVPWLGVATFALISTGVVATAVWLVRRLARTK